MRIEVFNNKFSTNAYVIFGENCTVVVDPGGCHERIIERLAAENRRVDFVLLTHGHFDHSLGCDRLEEKGAKIFMAESDGFLIGQPFLGITVPSFSFEPVTDGQILDLLGLSVRVVATAGHTPGSVCYIMQNNIFSGDTLFAGTVGRTDFPKGSTNDLNNSLKILAKLDENTVVLPGHGEKTTIKAEKQGNPYMKDAGI